MARKRYQRGSVTQIGDYWVGRWREDVIEDGQVKRICRKQRLGLVKDLSKKLAQRELDKRLVDINDPCYRARPTATFEQFAARWMETVLVQHKPSTQAADRSRLTRVLIPYFGGFKLTEIQGELVQQFVAKLTGSAKTARNMVATMRMVWKTAKAWGYVAHDPCASVVLPDYQRPEQSCFTVEQVRRILDASPEPYRTLWWLVSETGIRRGEVCALQVGDVDTVGGVVVVRRAISAGKVSAPKSKRPRVLSFSPELLVKLRLLTEGRPGDAWLFTNRDGGRLDPDNLVHRHLEPIVDSLGLKGGAHAFRHGNATLMDQLNTPMAVRQGRLGHMDTSTTMSYTHLISEDDRKVSAQIGKLITERVQ